MEELTNSLKSREVDEKKITKLIKKIKKSIDTPERTSVLIQSKLDTVFLKYPTLINFIQTNDQPYKKIIKYFIDEADNLRYYVKRLFLEELVKEFDSKTAFVYAKEIEARCYRNIIDRSSDNHNIYIRNWESDLFRNLYLTRFGILYEYKEVIIKKIKEDPSFISKLDNITERELDPESYVSIKNELDKRKNQVVEKKASQIFTCPRCKANNVSYEEIQMRGADESTDIICICLSCGCKFKPKV